jgi:hypothetical protein
MKNKIIIAISGKATSGKSELAKALCKVWPGAKVVSFAKPLKDKAMAEFGVTSEDLVTGKNKYVLGINNPWTLRQLLIEIGGMYRNIDVNFWVKAALKTIDDDESLTRVFIIDDLRFRNEAKMLRGREAFLVRIRRPYILEIDDPSEKDLDYYEDFDATIENSGSKEDLERLARRILHGCGLL